MPQTLSPDAPVTALSGIGPKKSGLYKKLGIETIRQLLLHLPRSYLDLRRPEALEDIIPNDGQMHLIHAAVLSKSGEQKIRHGLSVFHLRAVSDGADLLLTYFNSQYTVKSIPLEKEIYLYGTVGGTLLRREMNTPQIIAPDLVGYFAPVYPTTTGISSQTIAKDVAKALDAVCGITDALPDDLAKQCALPTLWEAVNTVHRPQSIDDIGRARKRITLAGLFSYSAAMLVLHGLRTRESTAPFGCTDAAPFFGSLPYSPTGAQVRAVGDICRDLASGHTMNRLVQGDVGCGKTLIAAAAIYCAAKSGYQSALMAPTEILAEQHCKTLSAMLSPFGIRVGVLTGSLPAARRRDVLSAAANGDVDLLVGTHALFQGGVNFRRLGLVVTDEQHRFGVAQRAALAGKGTGTHMLVMSATPIPRTMTLLIYGDLDLSVVDEMPAGRQKIATYRIDGSKRARALAYLRQHLDAGLQGYIVCPLVEEGENTPAGMADAVAYADRLRHGALAGYSVGLLHGRMKGAEKDEVMRSFARGDIQVLVATTVVEVGVDVPNAAVMIIENAERFGLSQLHQLRGRVGRGSAQSCCILISDAKSETAKERLRIIAAETDGFRIAQEDLRLRGPGEILGTRQHGLPNVDLISDPEMCTLAQNAAAEVLRRDPALVHHPALKAEVEGFLKNSEKTLN